MQEVGNPVTPGKPPVKPTGHWPFDRHAGRGADEPQIFSDFASIGGAARHRRLDRWIGEECSLVGSELEIYAARRRAKKGRGIDRSESEVALSDAGESGLVPPRDFVGEEVVALVFLERSAKATPACTRV